jgi:hypothetical protein
VLRKLHLTIQFLSSLSDENPFAKKACVREGLW